MVGTTLRIYLIFMKDITITVGRAQTRGITRVLQSSVALAVEKEMSINYRKIK